MSKYHKKVLRKQGECIFGNEKPISFQAPKAGPRPGQLVLALLRRQYFLKEIWGPPNQILDPLLIYMCTGTYVNICARCYVSVIKPVAKRTVHR